MARTQGDFRNRESKDVFKSLDDLTRSGHNFPRIFDDFLTAVVAALSLGQLEERYEEAVKRYKNGPDVFARSLGALILAMEQSQSDILGDVFEGAVSFGEHGQFFTPEELCRMMAQMTDDGGGESVNDPACGSGRLLLAAARINPRRLFVGCDVDERCVKMAAINLALNGLRGRVVLGNTLTLDERGHFRTSHLGIPGLVRWSTAKVLTERRSETPVVPELKDLRMPSVQRSLFDVEE